MSDKQDKRNAAENITPDIDGMPHSVAGVGDIIEMTKGRNRKKIEIGENIAPDIDAAPQFAADAGNIIAKSNRNREGDKNYKWEAAGSLTPELEGTPHSGVHKKRTSRQPEEHLK